MVMETPSPQCVGLEFVRQYYTVLNKAPEHLHRFYSNNSSFMHGRHNDHNGQPIIGQHDIHKKILSLNFRDCHAKIRLVDAHATLANGVVIQVTGELSNGGMPLRRFMQSFVLAPQTPKKYYVHNDIFRYQDEVFSDEDGGDEGGSEGEEEVDTPGMVEPNAVYHSPSPSAPPPTVNGTAHPQEPEPQTTAPLHTQTQQVGVPPTGGLSPTAATTPVMPAPPLSPTPPTPTPVDAAPPTPPTPEKEEVSWVPSAGGDNWDVSEAGSWAESTPTTKDTPDPDPPQSETPAVHQSVVPQEPKTFANLFKNTSGYSSNTVMPSAPAPATPTVPTAAPAAAPAAAAAAAPPPPPSPAAAAPPPAAPAPAAPVSQPPVPAATPQQPPQQSTTTTDYNEDMSWGSNDGWTETSQRSGQGFAQRQNRNPQNRQPPRDRPYRPASEENADFESFGEDRRRAPNVPDSQQIFVGNLPHATTEEELKTEFSRFGKIIDVRINTAKGKTGPKGQHQVPNFGFITFEDENAVNKVLSNRPIHLNGDHRLNVEEKKARQRMDGGGMGRQGSGRGMGERGGMRQGMGDRGGMQGGRGGRGGFNRDNTRGGPGGSRGTFQRR